MIIDFISTTMANLLVGINHYTGNFGLSLVVFAAVIKTILYSPTLQMYRSQKDMEKLKPKMESLKKQYPDEPQKLNEEMMKLYREEKINPAAGCLPMLIQMPILFGIWRAITGHPETFQSAYCLWVHPGTLQSRFPGIFASSLAEADLALVIFYGCMMLLSQRFTPGTGDPNQKMIGIYMSLMFTGMLWTMKWPSALVLYWSAFQLFSILQQVWIMKVLAQPAPAAQSLKPAREVVT